MSRFAVLGAGAALLAVTACAPANDPMTYGAANGPARCFTGAEVVNFRVENESRLYIQSRFGGAFRLDAAPNCFSPSMTTVAIEPAVGASRRICPGEEARVQVTDGSAIPKTCIARVSGPIMDSSISGLPG